MIPLTLNCSNFTNTNVSNHHKNRPRILQISIEIGLVAYNKIPGRKI